MIGMEIRAKLAGLPLKFPPLTMPMAAAVAIIVAAVAAMMAIVKLFQAAVRNLPASRPKKTSWYQRSETPSNRVIERLSLKE